MLPFAPTLTRADADRWTSAQLPRWLTRWFLTALWASAFATGVISDSGPCTPTRDCGPEYDFAWWVVVCFGTPLLLWWRPLLGCVFGVVFAAADVAYDDLDAARVAFGLHGLACVVVAALLIGSARAQAATLPAGRASAGARDTKVRWHMAPLAGAALLTVIGAVLFAVFLRLEAHEQVHLDRAERQDAVVVSADSDASKVTLLVADARRTIEVLDTGDYPVGLHTPVLTDPLDPHWVRLVSELQDNTLWETGGVAAVLLAVLLVAREVERRRAIARLLRGEHPAVTVSVLRHGDDTNYVVVDRAEVARLPSSGSIADPGDGWDEDEDELEAFSRAWSDEDDDEEHEFPPPREPVPGVLLGDLRDRGWALLLTEDGVVQPGGVLRVERALVPDADDEDDLGIEQLPGQAVTVADAPAREPEMPLALGGVWRSRALGLLMVAGGLAAGPVGILWIAESWYQRVLAAVIGFQCLLAGAARMSHRVVLTREALVLQGPLRISVLPWDSLHGIRREARTLFVAWELDSVDLGPFNGVDEKGAAELAGTMVLLRERSRAAGVPGREASSRLGPMWPLVAVYVVAVAAALFLR